MAINDDILAEIIKHESVTNDLTKGEIKKLLKLLRKTDAKITAKLANGKIADFSNKRLNGLLASIRKIIDSSYTDAFGRLNIELQDIAIAEQSYQLDMITSKLPIAYDMAKIAPSTLTAAVRAKPMRGKILKEWASELPGSAYNKVHDAVMIGYVDGSTNREITAEVARALKTSTNNARAVVTTAINHTVNSATNEVYNANADLIKGLQWVSAVDNRTSKICIERDLKVYKLNEGPRPPAHFNCRSRMTPVLKSWKELGINLREAPEGTRATMNGMVPASLSYRDIINKKITKAPAKVAKKPQAKPPTKAKARLKAPAFKSLAEAEDYAVSSGMAKAAKYTKNTNREGIRQAIDGITDVQARFNLPPLEFFGDTQKDTRYRYPKVLRAVAAVFSQTKAFHFGGRFTDTKKSRLSWEAGDKQKAFRLEDRAIKAASADEYVKQHLKQSEDAYHWGVRTSADPASETLTTAWHEMGHILHLTDPERKKEIDGIIKEANITKGRWGLLVSKYSLTNEKEYFAESFSIYMSGDESEFYRIHPDILKYIQSKDKA